LALVVVLSCCISYTDVNRGPVPRHQSSCGLNRHNEPPLKPPPRFGGVAIPRIHGAAPTALVEGDRSGRLPALAADGEDLAIWLEIGIGGTPELRVVPLRVPGGAAVAAELSSLYRYIQIVLRSLARTPPAGYFVGENALKRKRGTIGMLCSHGDAEFTPTPPVDVSVRVSVGRRPGSGSGRRTSPAWRSRRPGS